jgi:hypothetical protein
VLGLVLGKRVSVDGESLEYGEGAGGMITALELEPDGASFIGACFDKPDFKGIKFGESISFQFASFAGNMNFSEASFTGKANFSDASFTGNTNFGKAAFAGNANFGKASFAGNANFKEASFAGNANFKEASFTANASFNKAAFAGDTSFKEASFTGGANFKELSFAGSADFRKASFAVTASFGKAYFAGNANFKGASFAGGANFSEASFTENANFSEGIPRADANFDKASFAGNANFGKASFAGNADFKSASFAVTVDFTKASFTGKANFANATFTEEAYFDKLTFAGDAYFGNASFAVQAYFKEASFAVQAYFRGTSFTGNVDFNKASFTGNANFMSASFTGQANFQAVIFTKHMNFKNAKFAGPLYLTRAQIISSKEWATFEGATISSDLYLKEAKVVNSSFTGALMEHASIHGLDQIAYNGSDGGADHWLPSPYPTELGRSAENEKKSRGLCMQLGYLICQTVLGGGSGKNNGDDNDNDNSGDDGDDTDDGEDDTNSSTDVVEAAGLPQVHCVWIADLKLIAYLGMLCPCKDQVAVSVRGELHALLTLLRVQMDVQKQLLKVQTATAKGAVESSAVRAANAAKDVAIASKNRRWRKLIGAGREAVDMAKALTPQQQTVPTKQIQRRRTNNQHQVAPVDDVHVLDLAAHLSELYETGADLVAKIVDQLEGGGEKQTKGSASVSDLVEEAQRIGQDARMKLKESGKSVEERLKEFITTMIAGVSDCFKESLMELKQRLSNVAKHHAHKTLDDGFTRLHTYPWWQRLWKTVMQFDTLELNKHVDEIEQVQNE